MTTRHPDQPRLRDFATALVLLAIVVAGIPALVELVTGGLL